MTRFTPRRIALIVLAVATAGAAFYLFRPSGQSPTVPQPPAALLMVDAKPQGTLPGGPVPTPAEIETYRKTLTVLVKSEFVINAALRDPKLRDVEALRKQSDPAAWLAEHLTADLGENSSVLRIGVTGVPPKDAALLANAVAGAFLFEVVQKDIDAQRRRLQKMEDTQAELAKALDTRKKELNQTATATGAPPNAADHRALLAAMYQERTGLRVELAKARGEKDAEPVAREKRLRDDLAALDERIKSCEQADLDLTRAEVTRLEASVTAMSAEITRVRVELSAPSRVTMLALATVSDPTTTASRQP